MQRSKQADILTNDDTSDGHTHTPLKWNILAVVTFAWSMFFFNFYLGPGPYNVHYCYVD